MSDTILRDDSGKELGRIMRSGGQFILRDKTGAELGRFDPVTQITKDKNGKIVGRGNLLSFLILPK